MEHQPAAQQLAQPHEEQVDQSLSQQGREPELGWEQWENSSEEFGIFMKNPLQEPGQVLAPTPDGSRFNHFPHKNSKKTSYQYLLLL